MSKSLLLGMILLLSATLAWAQTPCTPSETDKTQITFSWEKVVPTVTLQPSGQVLNNDGYLLVASKNNGPFETIATTSAATLQATVKLIPGNVYAVAVQSSYRDASLKSYLSDNSCLVTVTIKLQTPKPGELPPPTNLKKAGEQ